MKSARYVSLFLLLHCGTGYASITYTMELDFYAETVAGSCVLLLTHDEPYSHLSSDCALLHEVENEPHAVVSNVPISGYNLGYPRPELPPAHYSWPTLDIFPKEDTEYCQRFGGEDNELVFGHFSDPNLNFPTPGLNACDDSPGKSPEVQSWIMPCFCQYKNGRQEMSWTSSDWSVPGQSLVTQKQSGGGWSNVWEGGAECIIFNAPLAGIVYRVKTIADGLFDSEWLEVTLQCNCTGGGGGGGGPL